MPARTEIAAIVADHPGVLPDAARRFLVDVICSDAFDETIAVRVLRRADLTADDAQRIMTFGGHRHWLIRAAWLARPEHDLDTYLDRLAAVAGVSGETTYVHAVLGEPLCRPELAQLLATCDNPTITCAVATCDDADLDVRGQAVLRTDELLTPAPDSTSGRYPIAVTGPLERVFDSVAVTDPERVAAWGRHLRTPRLILAAAAALPALDADTSRHAVHAGVLPALVNHLGDDIVDHIHTICVLGLDHLTAADRAAVLAAIADRADTREWPMLTTVAAALSVDVAADQPMNDIAYQDEAYATRAAAARHLVGALGDDPDAWVVLYAHSEHFSRNATTAEVVAVTVGVTRTAD